MNNEIEEILDNFKDYEKRYKQFNETQFIIFYRDIHLLLDYITNLQEENEKVHKDFNELSERYFFTKSRNEKAKSLTNRTIEIIKQQPSGNDEWILERLNGINYCLGGDEE